MAAVKFTLFADLHYIKEYYACTTKHLESIIDRAGNSESEFMMQLGDFSNDIIGSREVVDMYLNNKYGLPAYGIYGNHELECMHHGKADQDIPETMIYVTPYLTNRADEVHWGTPDGKPAPDGSIAYYWFERSGFRFICTDCGYSYNPATEDWEHNRNLYVRTKGNRPTECLGEPQRRWMEEVLTDAANNDIPCIVFSHPTFYPNWEGKAGDAALACEIFDRVNAIRQGTVVAVINGHRHSDAAAILNNIVFLDINVAVNGLWKPNSEDHYTEGQTFEYPKYDLQGNYLGSETKELTKVLNSRITWFFKDALCCVITVNDSGLVAVDGMETEWIYGVKPLVNSPHKVPRITSRSYKINRPAIDKE